MAATLADWRTAPLDERVRATLGLLEKVTLHPASLTAADVAPLRTLGIARQAIEDALVVAFCFNILDRIADAFGWHVPGKDGFDASAKILLSAGYKMPLRARPKRDSSPIPGP